jgi:hypothetical protein
VHHGYGCAVISSLGYTAVRFEQATAVRESHVAVKADAFTDHWEVRSVVRAFASTTRAKNFCAVRRVRWYNVLNKGSSLRSPGSSKGRYLDVQSYGRSTYTVLSALISRASGKDFGVLR